MFFYSLQRQKVNSFKFQIIKKCINVQKNICLFSTNILANIVYSLHIALFLKSKIFLKFIQHNLYK